MTSNIHSAIWKLMETGNYEDLTMEKIARTAGVSRPALYRRYADVGQVVLAALVAVGGSELPMTISDDIQVDLTFYFVTVAQSLELTEPIGKTMRGVLAQALVRESFAIEFAEFIAGRREPVRRRLLAWRPTLLEHEIDGAMDGLFGPVLYRILLRQLDMPRERIQLLVRQVAKALEG